MADDCDCLDSYATARRVSKFGDGSPSHTLPPKTLRERAAEPTTADIARWWGEALGIALDEPDPEEW